MKLTDHTLLDRIQSGDRAAFMLLYDRYWDSLYAFAFGRLRNKEAAEEILQNLWIKILEDPQAIQSDESGNAKGYLLRYLHYRIIDFYNSSKKNSSVVSIDESDLSIEITDTEYFEILEENDISALFEMINEVVSQLPLTEQKVFDLRIRESRSVDETAEALGLSNKTVSNKLSKTLGEVRKKLNPDYQSSKKLITMLMLMEIMSK